MPIDNDNEQLGQASTAVETGTPEPDGEAPACLRCSSRNVYVLSDRTVVCRRCGGRTRNGEGVDG